MSADGPPRRDTDPPPGSADARPDRGEAGARRGAEAADAFLRTVENGDAAGARAHLEAHSELPETSLSVAAALGREADVRRLLEVDPGRVHEKAGASSPATPLLWLCFSPFHGESAERDQGLEASARALLDAGADPNTRDARHGVPALYGVTGLNHAPAIARLLLEAGAAVDDGESVFHAAERYHLEALELLLEYGVDLNARGDWGNTPLYFLLRYWDVAGRPNVERGLRWLLDHGADPNVLCDRDLRENSLHAAVRRGQDPRIVELLLEHGADVHAPRGDGRTPWLLARRGGLDDLAALLEEAGASPEPLGPADELLAACGRGDVEGARRLAHPDTVAALEAEDHELLARAATDGRLGAVRAYIAAGFPVDAAEDDGVTPVHYAAIHGRAAVVRELLAAGADHSIRDREHDATPMGWARFGAEFMPDPGGDYAETIRALVDAGAAREGEVPE